MYFQNEKSRDAYVSATERLCELFPDTKGNVDAEYLLADRSRVVGISSLPIYVPICHALMGNKTFLDYVDSKNSDVHFVYGETVCEGGIAVPADVDAVIKAAVNAAVNGVGTLNEKGEHIIDLKGDVVGTHFAVNLLLGCRIGFETPMLTTPKAALDAFGRGAFRAGADTQVLASRTVMNADEAGEPVNRQFYITENNEQIFYSADVKTNVKSAVCTHKPNHSVIEYETECGLKITRTIFILPQYEGMADAVEAQTVKIENLTDRARDIRIVLTGMFGIMDAQALANDIVYVNVIHESSAVRDGDRVLAVSPSMHPAYGRRHRRFAAVIAGGEPMDEYCVSYSEFIGNGTLEKPQNVARLSSHPQRKSAPFFAMAKTLHIEAGESAVVDSFAGYTHDGEDSEGKLDGNVKVLFDKFSDHAATEAALEDVKKFYKDYSSYLQIETADGDLNAYVNNNLPFQVFYQSFLSRSFAWTQKSFRQIGFREIQDMYPSLYYLSAMGNADLAKTMISEWVKNVYEYGFANHNFYWWGNGAGDCSDDQLWLMQAVYRYVCHTGDIAFLDEEYPIAGSDKTRTVFETMMAAIEYSAKISVGKHGLPVLDHADWNDCLKLDEDSISAPEKFELYKKQLEEKGQEWGVPFENHFCESVMNAFLLKVAEDNLAEMADMAGKHEAAKALREMSEKLQANIQAHAWKEDFFARCLINNPAIPYTYVGAKGDGLSLDENADGTYFLNSFSWSILADSATEEQIAAMMIPLKAHVKTEAGLMLSSPCDLGKISSTTASDHYFHGDRENGAVFKHATMMSTAAMFKAAKKVKDEKLASELASLAFWMLDRVFPFKTMDNPYIFKGNPRFCTQYNNSETLEGIGPMLSGTASWLSLSVFEFLGIGYADGGLTFSPILPESMTDIKFRIKRNGTTFNVSVTKPEGFCRVGDTTKYYFDGAECGHIIPDPADGTAHEVRIVL
ncbi:MAG: glycosyl transferase [Ruminococcaceae bacterium]|nr:glycosyl transferase [Oscillospiraceae bacterium]